MEKYELLYGLAMTSTYTKLESMILDAIESGQNTFRKMLTGGIETE